MPLRAKIKRGQASEVLAPRHKATSFPSDRNQSCSQSLEQRAGLATGISQPPSSEKNPRLWSTSLSMHEMLQLGSACELVGSSRDVSYGS